MKPRDYVATPAEAGLALLDFLAGRLNLSRRGAKALIDARGVFVNRQRVWMARHKLRAGDCVTVTDTAPAGAAAAGPVKLRVLYQDAQYVVVDKPAGVLANGEGGSAEALLRAQLQAPELLAAHRLDRDTSGCLLCARDRAAFDAAVELFRSHSVRKTYHAIALGPVSPAERDINSPIEGQRAVTHIRVLGKTRAASHLQVSIETGRTHQIRRHLSVIRHPVVGDRQYGARVAAEGPWLQAPRQMLHAAEIAFVNPATGRPVHAFAPLPADFRACLSKLRL